MAFYGIESDGFEGNSLITDKEGLVFTRLAAQFGGV